MIAATIGVSLGIGTREEVERVVVGSGVVSSAISIIDELVVVGRTTRTRVDVSLVRSVVLDTLAVVCAIGSDFCVMS